MPSKREILDGQEQQRTCTESQGTVVQDFGGARYTRCTQASQDAATTATDRSSGVVAGS